MKMVLPRQTKKSEIICFFFFVNIQEIILFKCPFSEQEGRPRHLQRPCPCRIHMGGNPSYPENVAAVALPTRIVDSWWFAFVFSTSTVITKYLVPVKNQPRIFKTTITYNIYHGVFTQYVRILIKACRDATGWRYDYYIIFTRIY